MLLILLLSFLQLSGAVNNDTLLQESKDQARYYISNIQNGKNVEENIWALTLVATENAQIAKFVEEEVSSVDSQNQPLLSLFKKVERSYTAQLSKIVYKSGSSNLLISLLLETDTDDRRSLYQRFKSKFDHPDSKTIDYASICEAIINGKLITESFLAVDKFQLPHLFLLFSNNYSTFISKAYLKKMAQSRRHQESDNLKSAFSTAVYFRVLYLLDKYSETALFYDSLVNEQLFPYSSLKLNIYRYLDYSMYRLGYYDRSLEIVRNFTLPMAKEFSSESMYFNIRISQATYLYHIGKIREAHIVFEEIIKSAAPKEVKIKEASLSNNLAIAYYKMGQYEQYLSLQHKALKTAQINNNYEYQIRFYSNLFIYYRQSTSPDQGLVYLKKAQELAKKKGNKVDLGKIYTLLGSFYAEIKTNFDKAIIHFQKAEQTLSPKNDVKHYIDLLKEEEKVFKEQGKFDLALETQNSILELAASKTSRNHIDALVNKALIHLQTHEIQKAKQLIAKFKSLDLDKLDFQQLIKAKTVEADYLARTGNPEEALSILEPSLDQVVVRAKSSADLKSGFWHVENEYLDAFELAVSIYMENGEPKKAVEKLDQLKTINDASLYQNPLVKSSLLNESELTEYKRLTGQLDATRKKLLTTSESRQFELQQTISELKLKKRKLDRKLTEDAYSDPISVREVQNNLSGRELVFHITELNDQYYIAQISRSNVTINTIPLDSEFRDLLSNAVQQVATHKTNLDSLYKISQILELDEIPDYIEQITLIPDSYFYQLPIDILPLERPTYGYSYGETRYVIEDYRTQYLTSLNEFQSETKNRAAPNKLNYVGYGVSNFDGYNKQSLVPLPFAQTEVSTIANRLTNLTNVQTYINEQSTKSSFSETAPQARIIHLATHSEVSERDPMFSTVYLSNTGNSADSTFNNQVFAYELFELDLSNDMIMLNSCESGSGPYIQGTGIMGMSRALRYAGANSLVLNLWSVNDKLASDFAIHFYEQLNQGKSKAEALQETKRYFLTHKNADPHFWGPYMLIGDTDAVVEPNQNKNLAMAGIFIFYFLLMTGLSYLAENEIFFKKRRQQAA